MKKTLLALAVPALLAASAANAATVYEKDGQKFDVYGRAQVNLYNDVASGVNGSSAEDHSTFDGSARLGVKGSTAINDSWKALGRAEWKVTGEGSENGTFDARHIYAGFDGGQVGTFLFGRTDTAYYDVLAVTDVFNEWGSAANSTWGYRDTAAAGADFTGRQDGQAIYRNTFGGFTGSVTYVSARKANDLDYGYTASLSYAFDFGATVGVGSQKFNSEDGLKDQKDWAVSASYGVVGKDLYLAAMYNESKPETAGIEQSIKGYELAAVYSLANNWGFLGGYNYAKNHDTDVELTNEYLLGAQYNFTSNFYAYSEYLFDQRDDAKNEWTLALQYNF